MSNRFNYMSQSLLSQLVHICTNLNFGQKMYIGCYPLVKQWTAPDIPDVNAGLLQRSYSGVCVFVPMEEGVSSSFLSVSSDCLCAAWDFMICATNTNAFKFPEPQLLSNLIPPDALFTRTHTHAVTTTFSHQRRDIHHCHGRKSICVWRLCRQWTISITTVWIYFSLNIVAKC